MTGRLLNDSATLLVTGSQGFIGRHVVAAAQAAAVRFGEPRGDLRDPQVAKRAVASVRPTAVIHLAQATPAMSSSWAKDNITMLENLLDALAAAGAPVQLLLPGSAAQYGRGLSTPLSEAVPVEPLSAYGLNRCALEQTLLERARAGLVDATAARTFNLVGPGQAATAPVASWAEQIVSAEHGGPSVVRTGRLDVVRDFLDVRDAARAYLVLLDSGLRGVVNVCSGVATTLSTIAHALVEQAYLPIEIMRDPQLDRTDDPRYVVGDATRLREATGFTPKIPLDQSLVDVLQCVRAEHASGGVEL